MGSKVCSICGRRFASDGTTRRYCSAACSADAKRATKRRLRQRHSGSDVVALGVEAAPRASPPAPAAPAPAAPAPAPAPAPAAPSPSPAALSPRLREPAPPAAAFGEDGLDGAEGLDGARAPGRPNLAVIAGVGLVAVMLVLVVVAAGSLWFFR
jgi:hypothetical protein